MTAARSALPLIAPILLAAGGCAAEGTYPSLEPRPVEKLGFEEPDRPAPIVPSEPALRARVAELLQMARAGYNSFSEELGAARRASGAAGAAGSETWVVGQEAISRLEAAGSGTAFALAELDALAIARNSVPTNADDLAALNAAITAAQALADEQYAAINALRAGLNPA